MLPIGDTCPSIPKISSWLMAQLPKRRCFWNLPELTWFLGFLLLSWGGAVLKIEGKAVPSVSC